MRAVPADLCISSRWLLPMTARDVVLENHSLIVRDGRILDVLPSELGADRYTPAVTVDRPDHLLMPGLINARTRLVSGGRSGSGDEPLLRIAAMLRGGTTCCSDASDFPEESARAAAQQGLRVLIALPIAERPSAWARSAADHLTRALDFRDEYQGHPTITTALAPDSACAVSDTTFARIATLADELDAAVVMELHESRSQVEACVAAHGRRPVERLAALGLLTPALTAVHMVHVNEEDVGLALRAGVALTLCAGSNLQRGLGAPPLAAWVRSGLRLSVGTGTEIPLNGRDLWRELNLLCSLSLAAEPSGRSFDAWDSLAAATRGGAAALGLDSQIGTVEPGKWADLCCVDLAAVPVLGAAQSGAAADLAALLVFAGGRDVVSDVWVAGRHLLDRGEFTRLDWAQLAARLRVPQPTTGGDGP